MKHKSRTAPSSEVSWLEPTDSEIYLFSFSLRCQEPLTDAADSVSRSAAEHPQVSVAERWWKMFQTIQEQRKRPNPDPLKPCTHDNHSSFIKVYILILFVWEPDTEKVFLSKTIYRCHSKFTSNLKTINSPSRLCLTYYLLKSLAQL